MTLIEQIKAKNLEARKAKMTSVSSLLTTLVGEAEMVGKNAGNRAPTDAEVLAVIKKFIKNLDETIRVVSEKGNHSTAGRLHDEKVCLEQFLPKQLTEVELADHIRSIHAALRLRGDKVDMGTIMRVLKAQFDGCYDGKTASSLIKKELA